MKAPPRFDPVSKDPMGLKPQLSSLVNASYFHFWSHSQYRDRIILGDHDIPHVLDQVHHETFGHPEHVSYDGVHLRGHRGRKVFTNSVFGMFLKAGFIRTPPGKTVYNPMQMFRDRLQSHQQSSPSQSSSVRGSSNPLPSAPPRPSVIRPNVHQDCYNVPVSNNFDILGN